MLGEISKEGRDLGREENPDIFWSGFPKCRADTWTPRAVVDSMFAETQKAKDKMTFGFLEPGGDLTLPSSQINLEVDIYFIFSSISPVKKELFSP